MSNKNNQTTVRNKTQQKKNISSTVNFQRDANDIDELPHACMQRSRRRRAMQMSAHVRRRRKYGFQITANSTPH